MRVETKVRDGGGAIASTRVACAPQMRSRLRVELGARLAELLGLRGHTLRESFGYGDALLGRVFANIFGDLDDLRLPAKIALRVTLNVIYPSAPA